MPLRDLPVVEVVRRRDLHRAGAEFAIDLRIGDDRNRPIGQRQPDLFPHIRAIAIIVRIHRDRGIAEHRLRSRRGDDERPRAVGQWIADLPDRPHLFFVVDLEIRHRGAELRVPIDEALAPIDQAVVVQAHKGFEDRGRQAFVHREALAGPIARRAKTTHLMGDRRARFFLPRPYALDELVAAELVPRFAFGF